MIFDTVENLCLYAGFDAAFAAVADFVQSNDLAALAAGRYELCDGIFANVSDYEPGEGGKAEARRLYNDLQLMVTGSESIEVTPLSLCSENDGYKEDIDFYARREAVSPVVLSEGTFAFFAPQDAHRPCIFNGCKSVRKIVFKIPVK